MKIKIQLYKEKDIPEVKNFNERLKSRNINTKFPESNIPDWLPKDQSLSIYQEYFLAFIDEVVRGGYILKHQEFFINGKVISIADYQLPLSEGIVNSKYSYLGINLTLDALKRSPRLFAMGMGGMSEKLPKLLKAMKWDISQIPFHFMILNPNNFLKNITYLRSNLLRILFLDFLAYSKLGYLSIKILNFFKKQEYQKSKNNITISTCLRFDKQADILWHKVKGNYKFIALRTSKILNILYSKRVFKKLEIWDKDNYIGWAIVLDTKMKSHKQFGSMRVGSIVDCLSRPEDSIKIISGATKYLISRNVDLIVTNHSHEEWNNSLDRLGYLEGPSNYLFASSKDLSNEMGSFEKNKNKIYFTRGDGDGPINL